MRSAAASWIAGILLCAFGVIRIASVLPARSHQNDFAHYYVTSRLWLEGRAPYDTPFAPEFAKYGFQYDPRISSGGNAPPLVAFFAPIAALPVPAAFAVWAALQAAALVATLVMIGALLRDRLPARMLPVLLGLLVASNTLYFHFYYSQVQLLVGALLVGAYTLQRSRRYAAALALVIAAALLKLFPAVLLPWFVLTAPGSIRVKARRLLPGAAVAVGTIAMTWHLWPGFLHSGMAIVTNGVANRSFNFSVPSLVVNLGWAHYAFVPTPAEAARVWLLANASALLFIAFAYGAVFLERSVDLERRFCVLLLASMLASPTAWGHYVVLAFFPFCVFCAPLLSRLTAWRVVAIGLMYALTLNLGAGVSIQAWLTARANSGFPIPYAVRVLYAYCPLYGCLILAGALCWRRGPMRIARVAAPAISTS